MDEIARLTPTFAGVTYRMLDERGSVQWPCNDKAPEGTPIMHVNGFVRGKGKFIITEYIPTDETTGPRFPLLLTTGRILSQYNVGAQTRRTANVVWHDEDRLEIHPHDAEQRGVRDGDWVKLASRAGETTLRALITDRVAPGVVYTTFHHPDTQANVVTTDYSDWATNCPEYKVTAVQISPSNGPTALAAGLRRAHRARAAGSRRGKPRSRAGSARSNGCSVRSGGATRAPPASAPIPEETAVAFTYNGASYAVMMATPQDLKDFAHGFSLTEGIVASVDEIERLEVVEDALGIELRMWLAEPCASAYGERRRRLAGPTGCGLCGIEWLAEAMRAPRRVESGVTFSPGDIMKALERIGAGTVAQPRNPRRPCGGVLDAGAGLVAVREDVGRHNALDKLAGALAQRASPPVTGLVMLTSRVSVEMVQKAAAIGDSGRRWPSRHRRRSRCGWRRPRASHSLPSSAATASRYSPTATALWKGRRPCR